MSSLPRLPLLAAALLCTGTLLSAKTLIHAGQLIDGRADTARRNVTVTVDGDRITGIADGFTAPAAGDTVVDLKSATLMPGWMDMHVHITSEQSPTSYTEGFFMNPADQALRSTTYAKKTLLAGFTTVRDCGAGDKLNIALRDAVAKGGSRARASSPRAESPPPAPTATPPTASTPRSRPRSATRASASPTVPTSSAAPCASATRTAPT